MSQSNKVATAGIVPLSALKHTHPADHISRSSRTDPAEILTVTSRGLAAMNESNEFATARIVPLGALKDARRTDRISHGNRTDATEIPTVTSQSVRP